MGKLHRIRGTNLFSSSQPWFSAPSWSQSRMEFRNIKMPNPETLPLSISEHYRVPQKQKKRKKEIAFSNGTVQFVQNCAVPIRHFSLLTLCLCMQLLVFQNSSLNEIGKLQKRLS